MTTAVDNPEQVVIDYQPEDEQGRPIGRRTRVVAKDYPEAIEKMKAINVEATRALFRLKNTKPEARVEPVQPHVLTPEEAKAATDALLSQNPDEARLAVRRLVESELGLTPEDIKSLRQEKEVVRRQSETFRFLSDHQSDYNNTDANAAILRDYLERNNLAWTANNLEIAFLAVQDELIPPTTATSVEVPAEPVNPAPQRRAPSGMEPSNSHSTSSRPQGFTKADALKLAKEKTSEELRHWLANPANREKFERALNGR